METQQPNKLLFIMLLDAVVLQSMHKPNKQSVIVLTGS